MAIATEQAQKKKRKEEEKIIEKLKSIWTENEKRK
jgi:hypothetical protein